MISGVCEVVVAVEGVTDTGSVVSVVLVSIALLQSPVMPAGLVWIAASACPCTRKGTSWFEIWMASGVESWMASHVVVVVVVAVAVAVAVVVVVVIWLSS